MADRFDILKKILKGGSASYKVPTERPGIKAQKNAFDSFQRASSALYQQSLVGGVERLERVKDYDEMDHYPEITRALDIYADDSMTYAEDGKILQIVSDDDKVIHELEELLYQRLDLDFHLWTWIRNMCKYGDMFNLLDIVDKEGVLGAIAMPVGEIEREEGYNNDPNSLRFKWTAQGNTVFENYQVSHMRILGDDRFLPYGRSVLDSSRKVWRQLLMAEDAMLIYRISRAPERRVFYVDVGNIPPRDVDSYMQAARDKLKRVAVVGESTGNVDYKYNPESILEDFFIPVRGDRGSRIETLPGGENAAAIEDIEYLQNKLFISLGVPKSYLTAEEDLSGKSTLAQEDIKFARTIQRIQKIVVSELAKISLVHLYLRGYDESSIYNFDLRLTNPSTVTEMMHLELMGSRFSTANDMADSSLVSHEYIQKEILKLSSTDIVNIKLQLEEQSQNEHILEQIKMGEEPDAGGMAPPAEDGETDVEDNDDSAEENTTRQYTKDAMPYDPIGTRELPGYPKNYTFNEDEDEDEVEGDTSVSDKLDDPKNAEMKKTLEFIRKKAKNQRPKKDMFDRTISDIMKYDHVMKGMIGNLIKDQEENKLEESTLSLMKAKED
tara:strand:+ start:272 stop:2101 length:1830 start_codon:yes stop_codon:yes gene_type:complete